MNRLSGAYNAPVPFDSIQRSKENILGNMNGEIAISPLFGSYDYKGWFMSQENISNGKVGGLHGTKHKRDDIDQEINRLAGTRLEDLVGEILALCKDQHGCRYLQKKLEEGVPEHRDISFRETFSLFTELIADPFSHYLCQKLLEYSTDEKRNIICECSAHDLVGISLNMHGTCAVQKMIFFCLRNARLIHLNGNHIVQKYLNRFTSEDNQFIYNAVAVRCVEVANHCYGCCVLQRCIDHPSNSQRIQLVTEITLIVLTLVQDPYGSYVAQYNLDLDDNHFRGAVIEQFVGNLCALFVQKFTSNVIEKCIWRPCPGFHSYSARTYAWFTLAHAVSVLLDVATPP
ncbi:Pumilio-family RNA binding repeat [Ceratobasidium sp. AG-Ba]|nr:Pumilio-family RNA binding repeat [Ceratobasidium sp. AG-Ba]